VRHYGARMRIAPVLLAVATLFAALVAFGGAPGPACKVARILFPILLVLFLGSLTAPRFRPHG